MGPCGYPWVQMGTPGHSWGPIGTQVNPGAPMGTIGSHWNPRVRMGIHGYSWDRYAGLSMGNHENPWVYTHEPSKGNAVHVGRALSKGGCRAPASSACRQQVSEEEKNTPLCEGNRPQGHNQEGSLPSHGYPCGPMGTMYPWVPMGTHDHP
jgi:hypothetical protein